MAEAMAPEMRRLGLDGLVAPGCRFPWRVTKPVKDDSAAFGCEIGTTKAAAVEAKANKAAATTTGGMVKAASWSDFGAKLVGTKVALGSTIEPAAKVEGTKATLGSSVEPAAKVEGKPKPKVDGIKAALGSSVVEPAAKEEDSKPKPKVVSVEAEKVPDDFVRSLLKDPRRRLTLPPESFFEKHPRLRECSIKTTLANNRFVDVQEDILRQYHNKGYAVIGVERFDNGLKRLFILPEESTVLSEEYAA